MIEIDYSKCLKCEHCVILNKTQEIIYGYCSHKDDRILLGNPKKCRWFKENVK